MFNRRDTRCIDCGFLSLEEVEHQTGKTTPYERPATLNERKKAFVEGGLRPANKRYAELEYSCFRGVDFSAEFPGWVGKLNDGKVLGTRGERWWELLTSRWRCPLFEAHIRGATFDRHLDVQERRREWRRTAVVAVFASILGGVAASVVTVLLTR